MPRFRTPPETPPTQNTRTLAIPNSREWLAVFSDALAETINPYNYTQKDSESLTPEAAALIAYEAYEAWLQADEATGGECPEVTIPDSDPPKPIIRRNPDTGRFERLGSGEQFGLWIPFWADESWPTSGDSWPTIPNTHEEEVDPLCAAATNAAHTLKLIFEDVHAAYDDNIGADIAAADTVIFIGAQIGSLLALPVAPAIELGYAAWKFFYSLMDGLFTDFWSDLFTDNLVCILKNNAEMDGGGVVHFDYFGVQREILETIWTSQSFVLLVAQVNYMLYIIGPDGLDACGATDNVEADCSSCGTWCFYIERLADFFTLTQGYFNTYGDLFESNVGGWKYDASMVVDTTQCVITSIQFYHQQTSYTGYVHVSALPSNGPLSQTFTHAGGGPLTFTTDDNALWYTNSETTTVRLWKNVDSANHNSQVNWVRIRGTGVCPFGASNCT